jgi:NADPH:quinone reductase-like Zn-dependent oxidoreductase
VILDPVGGNYAALNLKLLALDGRWVLIGLMGGREAKLDLAQVLASACSCWARPCAVAMISSRPICSAI